MNIKILQWNTWYKEDVNNKLSLLKDINADICCLQELNENNNDFNTLKSELNLNGYLGLTDTDYGKQGNAILTKLPIITSQVFFIKEPKIPINHFSDEARIYIETRLNINDKILTIGTTHMSYTHKFEENKLKRKEEKKLLNSIDKNKNLFLFCGDLNVTENSKLIKKLEKRFNNASPDYTKKTWTTKEFDYEGFKVDSLDYRLDYVFTTKDIKIINSELINTNYSDHLPILVEIEV
jgi:endonuclease/exonuclease/phosphatase family metal-dependent hydrolase